MAKWVTSIRTILMLLIVLFLASGVVHGQAPVPQCKDYPALGRYHGKNSPLVLTQEDLMYRTRLRKASTEKPNFAGQYIVTTWGCGAECVMGAVIDANSGKVYWLPHTVCCWGFDVDDKFQPIKFQLSSRLIVFSGERNEKEGDNGVHFYEFKDGRFVHIQSILKGKQ